MISTLENIKKIVFRFILILFIVTGISFAYGQDLPVATGKIVNDFTGTLSSEELRALEQKLVSFSDSTSTQIAVVLIKSTGDYEIADYAVRLANQWAIGQAKYDNGILLLAAIGDRAVTIQTGYGIEGAVPDAIAYRIIENDIKPAFRQGQYYSGLDAATSSLIKYTRGEYKADTVKQSKSSGKGVSGIVALVIIFIIISLISKGGGGKNKGGRVMNGKGASDIFWWMLLSGLGGGNRSGRDGGGGFGDGGGFGGFGGGGFGGGGASGRW